MPLPSFSKAFLLCLSLAFVTQIAYKIFSNKKKKALKPTEIHEVIMFSSDSVELMKSKHSRCGITRSMERVLYYLKSPRYTLDVCIYVLTNLDIANAILKLHYRGVKVRLIVDADMAFSSGSNVRKLEKQGIPVRWMKSTNLMHHKFCVIDASTNNSQAIPLVMTGSLNWTNQAMYGNWENVLVTSQKELVQQYTAEFERLWVMFKPVVDFT